MDTTTAKPQPNRGLYIEALRRLTDEQRLEKAFELSEMTHEALRVAIRTRYPDMTPERQHAIYLERLERCRRRNS